MSSPVMSLQVCQERATAHHSVARFLFAYQNEWFAVCYFYAAYMTVRSAILCDPIFGDLNRLRWHGLIPDDRFTERHRGRSVRGNRSFGVNDIVRKLYPDVASAYLGLHSASVEVRYGAGLRLPSRTGAQAWYADVATAAQNGDQVAT